jgi:DNA-binding winged helix-turn-helix (wHTH) protein
MSVGAAPVNLVPAFDDRYSRPNLRLRVGEHVLDVGALRLITRPDYPRLTGKAVAVLLQLVRCRGDTVTREQLLDRVWANRVTTPDVLTQAIKELRRAFADDSKSARYIETIPRVGYRLLAPVAVLDHDIAAPDPALAQRTAGNDPDVAASSPAVTEKVAAQAKRRWPWLALMAIGAMVAAFVLRAAPTNAQSDWQLNDTSTLSSDANAQDVARVSPDGRWRAFQRGDVAYSEIWIVSADGKSSRRLAHLRASIRGYTWSPNSDALIFASDHEGRFALYAVGVDDAAIHPVHAEFPDVRDAMLP